MELRGTALITGGASGLGLATAEVLSRAGMDVALVDLTDGVETTAATLPGPAVGCVADVAEPDAVTAALDRATRELGPLRVLVTCAGITLGERTLGRAGPHALESFETVIRTNLVGTFNVARLAAARMAGTEPDAGGERGVIVTTASIAAFDGQTGQVAYAAAKGAVAAMTLPMARDLAQSGIRCVAIAPGIFDTPMLQGLPEQVRAGLHEDVPHPHRLGDPREFGALVRSIVENPYLNGATIRLDAALRMGPG